MLHFTGFELFGLSSAYQPQVSVGALSSGIR